MCCTLSRCLARAASSMLNQKCVARSAQGDAGSIQLARALKEHTNEKLVEVDIGYNEIKDEGACALAQVR